MILKNKVAAIVSLSVASAFLFTGKTASAIELVNTDTFMLTIADNRPQHIS